LLPDFWQTITLFNPIVYLISGFRWIFLGRGDVAIGISMAAVLASFTVCLSETLWLSRLGCGQRANPHL
jgi:ABC-2 type transport system permease protein